MNKSHETIRDGHHLLFVATVALAAVATSVGVTMFAVDLMHSANFGAMIDPTFRKVTEMKKFVTAFALTAALITIPAAADARGGGGGFGGGGHMGGFGGGFHGGEIGGFHAGEIGHLGGSPAFHPGGFAHHYGPGWRGGVLIDPAVPCSTYPYYYDPTSGADCG